MQPLTTSLNYGLVAISVSISIIASYAAFSFADRVAKSSGSTLFMWLMSGGVTLGLGVWSMHYLGMLAVRLPIVVYYHVPTVVVSLQLAMLASFNALIVVSRPSLKAGQLAVGSLVMGTGIGTMHYTGMHAMRCSAMHRYNVWLVALSVIVAVAFSWGALWIAFVVRSRKEHQEWLRVGGAAVMGVGIAAMHYTAMAAVTFWPGSMPFSTANTIQITTIGIAAVTATTGLVLIGALVSTLVDRNFYEQLRKERDYLNAVAECSLDSLYLCEAIRNAKGEIEDFRFIYLNSNVEKTTRIPLREMLAGRMREMLPLAESLGHIELYKKVVATGEPLVTEFSILNDYQQTVWVRIHAVKLRDGLVITASDVTARKRDEEHMLQLAHHDPLTGLINRSLLYDRVDQALERSRRFGGITAIFMIDVDTFKRINDTLGHSAGDGVLVTVAHRLKSSVRAIDSVIRVGGDEFVVVMPDMNTLSDVEHIARKFVSAFQPAIWLDGNSLSVTCSVGVSTCSSSAATSLELLAEADAAMYIAKRNGKNHFEIWRTETGTGSPSPAVVGSERQLV